jgi:PST family polysaccharide transporter
MALVEFAKFHDFIRKYCHLGFSNGIVKYVAEIKEDKCRFEKLLSTVF